MNRRLMIMIKMKPGRCQRQLSAGTLYDLRTFALLSLLHSSQWNHRLQPNSHRNILPYSKKNITMLVTQFNYEDQAAINSQPKSHSWLWEVYMFIFKQRWQIAIRFSKHCSGSVYPWLYRVLIHKVKRLTFQSPTVNQGYNFPNYIL